MGMTLARTAADFISQRAEGFHAGDYIGWKEAGASFRADSFRSHFIAAHTLGFVTQEPIKSSVFMRV